MNFQRAALGMVMLLLAIAQTGCICLSFGGTSESEDHATFVQTRKLVLQPGQELDVYYPVPYASPPNLEIEDTWRSCVVIDQKPDHFRIRSDSRFGQVFGEDVKWTARGIRAATPIAVSVQPPITPTASSASP